MAYMHTSPLVKERLVEQLRGQIMQLQTDHLLKIPSERSLSDNLQASRVSIRAAIKILVSEGLLVQLHGKGTYIVPAVRMDTLYVVVSPDIKSNDPFYNKFLVEITNLAAKHDIKISMVHPDRPLGPAAPSPLVIVGQLEDDALDRLKAACGTLFAVQQYAHRDDIVQIYFDDYKIGSKAAKALVDRGYRSLALLAGPDKYSSAKLRKLGFLDTARRRGASVRTISEKMNWEGGCRAADKLTALGLPEAIFAVNDWMAVGFIQRLREQGLKVPNDISVIGCDDIPLASEISPRLTTFHLDMKHLVEELFSAIHNSLTKPNPLPEEIVLSAAFIGRESLSYHSEQRGQ